jgi:hypothetical protein
MLTGLIGTGGAILLVGVALLIANHREHVPGRASGEWLLTGAIVMMLLAGVEFTYVGVGHWVISLIHTVVGWVGHVGMVIVALIAAALLLKVLIAIFKTATDRALWLAFMFPVMCAVPSYGFFRQMAQFLRPPAQQLTTLLQAKMGA